MVENCPKFCYSCSSFESVSRGTRKEWAGYLHPHCPEPCQTPKGLLNQFELRNTKINRIIPCLNFFSFFVGTKQIQSSFGYKILQSEGSTMEQKSITQQSFISFCLHSFLTCPSALVHCSKYQAIFLYWGHVTRYVIHVLLLLFNRWHFRNKKFIKNSGPNCFNFFTQITLRVWTKWVHFL